MGTPGAELWRAPGKILRRLQDSLFFRKGEGFPDVIRIQFSSGGNVARFLSSYRQPGAYHVTMTATDDGELGRDEYLGLVEQALQENLGSGDFDAAETVTASLLWSARGTEPAPPRSM